MKLLPIALASLLAATTLAYGQQTRSQLNTFNAQNFNANGRNGVTGPTLNNMNGQFITSFGAIGDTNTWTGTNTFSGPILFGPNTSIPVANGGSVNVTEAVGGWVGDGQTGAATVTANSSSFLGVAATKGQMFAMMGVGVNGAPFQTTVAATATLASVPSYSSGTYYGSGDYCPVTAPGSGVNPGDSFTLGGGGYNANTVCKALSTAVQTAAVVSAGTGASVSATQCVVSGTTGYTGGTVLVPFTALAIMNGSGGIASISTVLYGGQYLLNGNASGNPTNINNEPVTSLSTGCNTLTGAALSITLGVGYAQMTTPGNASSLPSSPQTPISTTGGGTGVTFSVSYLQTGTAYWGTDNLANIRKLFTTAPADDYSIPPGVYMTSCPPSSNYFSAASSISLHGVQGQSIIRFSPGCQQVDQGNLFAYLSGGTFDWRRVTIDLNGSTFAGSNPANRHVGAAIFLTGNCKNVNFDNINVLNAQAGQIGIWGFESNGNVCDHVRITGGYFTQNTRIGPVSHAIYFGYSTTTGGDWTDLEASGYKAVGWNTSFEGHGVKIHDCDVGFQGYGPGVGLGFGATLTGSNGSVERCDLHDSHGFDFGDSDPNSGIEAYSSNTIYANNRIWNNAGPGIKTCAENVTVSNNLIWDNGFLFWGSQQTGSTRWNTATGIAVARFSGLVNPTQVCDSAGFSAFGNRAWDSYTQAVAWGLPTTGLSVKQAYGLSEIGLSDMDFAKVFTVNNFANNSQGFLYSSSDELIDLPTSAALIQNAPTTWSEASVASATSGYWWAPLSFEAGQSIPAVSPYNGVVHNLSIKLINTPTGSPSVITLYAGSVPGTVAATALTCTVAVGDTTCADTADSVSLPSGWVYFWKIDNPGGAATGQVRLIFQDDRSN